MRSFPLPAVICTAADAVWEKVLSPAPPMTVVICAATAADPRVTAEAPVRERAPMFWTLAKDPSSSVASEATARVPAPPEPATMESLARTCPSATVTRSVPYPPTMVRERESPEVWVIFVRPSPP